jgi:hypothetical protein
LDRFLSAVTYFSIINWLFPFMSIGESMLTACGVESYGGIICSMEVIFVPNL